MKKLLLCFIVAALITLSGCSAGKIITGKVIARGSCADEEFGVKVDSPILIRTVEMVQYAKTEDGSGKLVLANYPLESFDSYTNPEFPSDLLTTVFFADVSIGENVLTKSQVESLVYNNVDALRPVTDIEETNNSFGLVLSNGAYITPSDEWNLGDIKVSFYTLDIDTEKEYTIFK